MTKKQVIQDAIAVHNALITPEHRQAARQELADLIARCQSSDCTRGDILQLASYARPTNQWKLDGADAEVINAVNSAIKTVKTMNRLSRLAAQRYHRSTVEVA